MEKWRWEKPGGGVLTDGALEDLFKAEPRKAPGHLSVDPPGDSATLLAREAIQNSWDSAIERAGHASDRRMTLEFKFDRLPVADTRRLIDTLGLEELKHRSDLVGDWKTVQLHNADTFHFMEQGASLEVLTVTETGTTGMYGPWDPQLMETSKMILALLSVGISQGDEKGQRGGSFGHGKAGLLSASATRTVVAYSCFNDDEHLSGATRRLYGMTYWKSHGIENQRFLGFGHFGDQRNENETFPFEDAEADRVAQELGLEIRDPDNLGTTSLLIEPVITPEDLKLAVERNWWPALIQYDDLIIDIVDQDVFRSVTPLIAMYPRVVAPSVVADIQIVGANQQCGRFTLRSKNISFVNTRGPVEFRGDRNRPGNGVQRSVEDRVEVGRLVADRDRVVATVTGDEIRGPAVRRQHVDGVSR